MQKGRTMRMDDQEHFKTIAAAHPKAQPDLSKKLNGANSHSGLDPDYLLSRAQLLFNCYRKDEVNEPEIYSAAIAAVLGDGYSRSIVDYVTDPRTGLPSRQKFLPTVAEVREACDARTAHIARMDRYSELKTIPVARPQTVCKPGQITYGEFLQKAAKGETKPRPIGAFEPGGYLGTTS
jgi:hypothetical protein